MKQFLLRTFAVRDLNFGLSAQALLALTLTHIAAFFYPYPSPTLVCQQLIDGNYNLKLTREQGGEEIGHLLGLDEYHRLVGGRLLLEDLQQLIPLLKLPYLFYI